MTTRLLQLFFSFLLLSCTYYVNAFDVGSFQPIISKKVINPECNLRSNEALEMAKAMFFSKEPHLNHFCIAIPKKVNSKMVIESGYNINQDSLIVKDDSFKKIVKKEPKCDWCPESIYWQNKTEKGFRLVLDEDPVGWRGFMYHMFLIRADVSVDEFLDVLYKRDNHSGEIPEYVNNSIFISQQWQPPLVLKDQNNLLWVIEFGQGENWKVFSIDHKGIQLCCSIHFRPKHKKIKELLPQEVNKLANFLDKTLGEEEAWPGTMQAMSRIKIEVNNNWDNVALRPWVKVQSFNSRREVDIQLKNWSQVSTFNSKLYQNILQQYKKAGSALVRYYQEQFQMDKSTATNRAKYQLDMVFRSYFPPEGVC